MVNLNGRKAENGGNSQSNVAGNSPFLDPAVFLKNVNKEALLLKKYSSCLKLFMLE
ncbi:hypothetical protein BPIT_09040 [Candidatus Brocadia pituitae]|nr:hypothetical protein BPIT_09040 [Candidatus Brocadia pituitae]